MAQLGIQKTQMQEVQVRIILIYLALAYWGENEQLREGHSKDERVLYFLLLLGNKIVFYFSFQKDMFESKRLKVSSESLSSCSYLKLIFS